MGSPNSSGSKGLTLFPFILEETTPGWAPGLTLFPFILEETTPSDENPNSTDSNGLTFFPFILEGSTPSDEFESARVQNPVRIPILLNLFPLTRGVESSPRQRDSTQGLGLKTLQTILREPSIDAVTRRETKRLLSQFEHHEPTLPLFKCPDSGYVRRNESPVQMSKIRDIQQDLPVLTSGAPSIGQTQFTGHGQVSPPSANSPPQDHYVTSSRGKGANKGKGKMFEADGRLSNIGTNYLDFSGWKSMMLAPRNSNGSSGFASDSSMAATLNYLPMAANINPSQNLMGVPYLDAEGVGTVVPKMSRNQTKHSNAGRKALARHGPLPKSSPFTGVTHLKEKDRWVAHVWFFCNCKTSRTLTELSDSKLLYILRKQSFGEGTLYPDYPPLKEH